jgi:alpha-1,2-mannosyltransferase
MFSISSLYTELSHPTGTYAEFWRRWQFFALGYLIAAVGIWLTWLAPWNDLVDRSGTPFGGDFVMFYSAGQVVLDGRLAELYDDATNQARTSRLIPNIDPHESWPYRYPPAVALGFVPLARLPYATACILFMFLSLGLLTSAGWMLWRLTVWSQPSRALSLGSDSLTIGSQSLAILLIGWPVAIETLVGGQLSTLALWIVAATLTLLRRKCDVAAGLVASLAIYKPNVLLFFVVGCIIRFPRMLAGLCGGVLAIVTITGFAMGWESWFTFAELGSRLATANWSLETPAEKVHGLVPWLQPFLADLARPTLLGIGLVSVGVLGFIWRSRKDQDGNMVASLLLINALFNPYVPIYDLLVLAAVPLLLFGMPRLVGQRKTSDLPDAAIGEPCLCPRWLEFALFAFYFGPHVSQALATRIGWQLFPLWLLSATAIVVRATLPRNAWAKLAATKFAFESRGKIRAIDGR